MVRGWLERGVDGFRLDVFNCFLKHPDLPSNPTQPGTTAWTRQIHVYDRDQPDFPALIGRFRAVVDAAPGRMSIGELFDGTIETAADLATDRHLVFDWELITTHWTGESVRAAIAARESAFGPAKWPAAVLSNHDQSRHATRFARSAGQAGGAGDQDTVARAAAVLLLTLRGTPFLYYGEELGLGDVDIPLEESVDPPAKRTFADFVWWDRSRCRTPMPWSGGPGAGFTSGQPWLRLGPDAETRNVTAQLADPDSVLSLYRRLIRLRAATPALQVGDLELEATTEPDVVAYTREADGQGILVVLNLGPAGITWRLPEVPDGAGWRLLLTTSAARSADAVLVGGSIAVLEADEGLILERIT
jgi:alpha-glucosidase